MFDDSKVDMEVDADPASSTREAKGKEKQRREEEVEHRPVRPFRYSKPFLDVVRKLRAIGALSVEDYLAIPFDPLNVKQKQRQALPQQQQPLPAPQPALDQAADGQDEDNLKREIETKMDARSEGGAEDTSVPSSGEEAEVAEGAAGGKEDGRGEEPEEEPGEDSSALMTLVQACRRTFGRAHALDFEFTYLREDDKQYRECILTIGRPNGARRSYRTGLRPWKQRQLKLRVAQIALELGALQFITSGAATGASATPTHSVVAGPSPALPALSPADLEDPDKLLHVDDTMLVLKIDALCAAAPRGGVASEWFVYQAPKSHKVGAALRIRLSAHVYRVYSTDAIYDNEETAKHGCAKTALEEGLVEYVKSAGAFASTPPDQNDQDVVKLPFSPVSPIAPSSSATAEESMKPMTVQSFFESLPQPFPESLGGKSISEFSVAGWLNLVLQSARGSRLRQSFFWFMNGRLGLNGCVLRLDRPGECRSYVVDARFPKRVDAKSAVCLLAMSDGVGKYIRGLAAAAESRVPPTHKRLFAQHLHPVLLAECKKIRPELKPVFEPVCERDAFGCVLKIDLSHSPNTPNVRTYTVEPEYKSQNDAKVAVACLAAEQGIIDLLRYGIEHPPPGHQPFWASAQVQSFLSCGLGTGGGAGSGKAKKRKAPAPAGEQGGGPGFSTDAGVPAGDDGPEMGAASAQARSSKKRKKHRPQAQLRRSASQSDDAQQYSLPTRPAVPPIPFTSTPPFALPPQGTGRAPPPVSSSWSSSHSYARGYDYGRGYGYGDGYGSAYGPQGSGTNTRPAAAGPGAFVPTGTLAVQQRPGRHMPGAAGAGGVASASSSSTTTTSLSAAAGAGVSAASALTSVYAALPRQSRSEAHVGSANPAAHVNASAAGGVSVPFVSPGQSVGAVAGQLTMPFRPQQQQQFTSGVQAFPGHLSMPAYSHVPVPAPAPASTPSSDAWPTFRGRSQGQNQSQTWLPRQPQKQFKFGPRAGDPRRRGRRLSGFSTEERKLEEGELAE